MNFLKQIGNGVLSLYRQAANYRYMMFSTGIVKADIDLISYEQFDDFIRDTVGACLDVRRVLRANCELDITGSDAARFRRAIEAGDGFTTEQDFVGKISLNYDVFGNFLARLARHATVNLLDFVETQDIVFRADRRRIVQIGIRQPEGKILWHEAKDFFHFKRANVFSPIGRSLVGELSEYLKMKRYLSGSWARHFATDGAPAGYLTFKSKRINEEQKKQIREDWNKQYSWDRINSAVGILEAEGEYVQFPQRQLNYGEDHKTIRDSIREACRTPKVLLGDTDGVNFSNAFTSILAFKMTEVDAWHNELSKELTYFAKRNGYNCEVKVAGTLSLEDFFKLTGATGLLKPNQAEAV